MVLYFWDLLAVIREVPSVGGLYAAFIMPATRSHQTWRLMPLMVIVKMSTKKDLKMGQ